MSTNPPDTSADLGSGDDVPGTIAPSPRPLTPTDVTYQGVSDAEMGIATDAPVQADGEITQQLRLPEPSSIVSWDSDSDQLNPMNWSSTKRWANTAVISAMTFSTPLASTMFAPGVPLVMDEFRSTNRILETLCSLDLCPRFRYGSSYRCANVRTQDVPELLLPPLVARVSATCSQEIEEEWPWQFGEWDPLAGPIVGPIVGGFLAEGAGWRWAFWLEAIIAGLTLVLGSFLLQETYPVVILEKKTKRIIKETGDSSKVSALHHKDSPLQYFTNAIIRPLKMLFLSPIVFLLSVYYAVLFGYLYLFIATFPTTFASQYHFSISTTGLAYLGLGCGIGIGLFTSGKASDPLFQKLTKRNGGIAEPEYRLPALMATSPLIAIAFFVYGWTAELKIPWIVPIIGTSFFGIGLIPAFLSINMYLVDSFPTYAASAITATKVFQSIGGAFLPLAGPPLYAALGLGWGNTVLGVCGVGVFSGADFVF
ncbi:hypothetical protein EYC80_008221 [Monilinia laxa]|uniref:Major facilitator superfamily (MFS) profile domain-containing protein n=1 Tax=Monilinia laxa TaxID=61186 RepID=A0A5N6JVP4_MONLA|nr:hypothetical protein EYC80_008221 [Monilinia laxa]